MEKFKNTYKRGVATTIIYPEDNLYTAVCLEFDLVEQAEDFGEVKDKIDDAVRSHVETVVRNKLPEGLLNRPAPEKYWKKYKEIVQKLEKRKVVQLKPVALQRLPIKELAPVTV